jgi:hypothetical protein
MSGRPRRLSVRIRTQIALLSLVVAAALLATWQFGEASGAYQDAVRQEIKRQTAVVEDARFVYGEEGPPAFTVAVAETRAERLRPLRNDGRPAASEYAVAAQTAFQLHRAARPDSLLGNSTYRQDLGYDLPRRLADIQTGSPDLYGLDPGATLQRGDSWSVAGRVSVAVGAAVVLAALCAANVLRPHRWQQARTPSGRRVLRNLDIIPQPAIAPAGRRRAVLLHLVVFVLPLLLPLGQTLAAGNEQRALAEAARDDIRLSTSISLQLHRTAFLSNSLVAAKVAELQAPARELAALDTGIGPGAAHHERRTAAVERVVARDTEAIARYMGRPPTRADGVDPQTVTAMAQDLRDLSAAQAEQHRQVDLADSAGRRSLYLSAATSLAVVAEILAVAALAARSRGWRWWPAVCAVLSVAVTAAAYL